MAAVLTLPSVDRPFMKPPRKTHPLQDPKRKMKKGEPFDPEDLSRRLKAHLSEQKIEADRRRLARAAAAQQKALYHHVPSGAATAFEKTTTPEGLRQVHRLSQPVLKQLEGLCLDDSVPGRPLKTSLQRTQALDQTAAERDTLRNRNQFQWTHGMEEAAEVDDERAVYKLPTRNFDAAISNVRRIPAGLMEEEHGHAKTKAGIDVNSRHDWAQRDEEELEIRRTVKELVNPFSMKRHSIWTLRSKKEQSPEHGKNEDTVLPPIPEGGRQQMRSGLLGRFKRRSG